MALSLVLLISAGLMLRTFVRLRRVDPGFEFGDVLTMKLSIPSSGYPTLDDQAAFYDERLEEVQPSTGKTAPRIIPARAAILFSLSACLRSTAASLRRPFGLGIRAPVRQARADA